jgi:hypothetical protein
LGLQRKVGCDGVAVDGSPFSAVRFGWGYRGILAYLAYFVLNGADFLCGRDWVAERVGFEPTLEFPLNTLSKRAPSATRPSLRLDAMEGTTLKKLSIPCRENYGDFTALASPQFYVEVAVPATGGERMWRGIKTRKTTGYEPVSDESGVGATADAAADGELAVETDAAPGAAPAAMALAFLPFSDTAGRGGTFVLSTT